MIIKPLKKWNDFKDVLQEIYEEYGIRIYKNKDTAKDEEVRENDVLYRGQNNPNWELTTTLERFYKKQMNIEEYCHITNVCAPQIESFTETDWNLPTLPEILNELKKDEERFWNPIPDSIYSYWVYLRHHGFPSPLLDWTKSPYIAAFFAFSEKVASDNVSIFIYIEQRRGFKSWDDGDPNINVCGPYVRTHKRHFLQKSTYTICTQYDYSDKKRCFVPHQDVFETGDPDQDTLIRIDIPSSERMAALKDLDQFNINHFSLFQTEDSLVKSLAFSELELKNK